VAIRWPTFGAATDPTALGHVLVERLPQADRTLLGQIDFVLHY
jgi:hypothetical protein